MGTFTLNSKVLTTIYVVSKNMKISVIFVLVLACLMVLTEALPHRYHGSRYGNRRHRNRRPGRNNFGQGLGISQSSLKQHGRDKFIVGAAIKGAGLLTGNQQLQQLGAGIAGLGLKAKLAAHLFP